jgi:hypothetical protein
LPRARNRYTTWISAYGTEAKLIPLDTFRYFDYPGVSRTVRGQPAGSPAACTLSASRLSRSSFRLSCRVC